MGPQRLASQLLSITWPQRLESQLLIILVIVFIAVAATIVSRRRLDDVDRALFGSLFSFLHAFRHSPVVGAFLFLFSQQIDPMDYYLRAVTHAYWKNGRWTEILSFRSRTHPRIWSKAWAGNCVCVIRNHRVLEEQGSK
jgi:hypothetical protein